MSKEEPRVNSNVRSAKVWLHFQQHRKMLTFTIFTKKDSIYFSVYIKK